jgi:hypothetical protein
VAPEVLRPLALYRQVFYAILLLILVIFGQQAQVGFLRWRRERRSRAGRAAPGRKESEA